MEALHAKVIKEKTAGVLEEKIRRMANKHLVDSSGDIHRVAAELLKLRDSGRIKLGSDDDKVLLAYQAMALGKGSVHSLAKSLDVPPYIVALGLIAILWFVFRRILK